MDPRTHTTHRKVQASVVGGLALLLSATACADDPGVDREGRGAADTGSWDGALEWEPCGGGEGAECGTLTVPVDWDDPDGATVDLSLTRHTAEDPDERIGPLLYLAGGPGDPGALHVRFMPELFGERVREQFDLVGLDPRGVNDSGAVVCSEDLLDAEPDAYLHSQEDFDERVEYNRALREDCREHTGPLYDHVDTLSVAHDVDAVRAAMGEERITAYGTSYGTAVGALYAEQYPDRVRAMALDGLVDRNADTEDFVGLRVESMQAAFDAFVDWCADEGSCALHGQSVPEIWADLLERADADGLEGQEGPLTSYELVEQVHECAYEPDWAGLADHLAALGSGQVAEGTACGGDEEDAGPPVEIQDSRGLSVANFCSDYDLAVDDHEGWHDLMERTGDEHGPDVGLSPNAVQRIADCLGGHHPATRPQHGQETDREAPILLTSTVADPITGHNQAARVAEQLGDRASLLTYEGAGHGAYGFFSGSECVTEAVDDFLVTASPPEDGTTCPDARG
ncbi:alpha/beta fold hydrolase [Nocardiopsis nanhaiensis]